MVRWMIDDILSEMGSKNRKTTKQQSRSRKQKMKSGFRKKERTGFVSAREEERREVERKAAVKKKRS